VALKELPELQALQEPQASQVPLVLQVFKGYQEFQVHLASWTFPISMP
jgi:hypothetical protein